jgi:hypothetical protein
MKRVARKLKKYFIPHEENGYKPHLLRPRTVAFLFLVMIVAEAAFLIGPMYFSSRSRLFGVILVNALVDGTNQNRVANSLPALTVSPLLQAAAEEKANDMVKNNYFAHTSPTGVTPWYWFENVGYAFSYAGENLAVNFSDSQDVTNAWMNSPEHRANILGVNFTQIGIATATGTYEGKPAVYVAELFGTPSAAPVAFVDTAQAAGAPPVVVAAPVVAAGKASAKPSAAAAAPIASVPTIIATSALEDSSSQQLFVAVKGASIENLPATQTVTQTVPVTTPATSNASVSQNNPVQDAAASPRQIANNFYLFLIALFVGALALNIFVKIRIQHPQLIFDGVLVIAVAALFIVLNQQVFLLHASIF